MTTVTDRCAEARRAGFSLLEMLVVVAIIAAIALVAVPMATVSDAYKLELAASDVAEALRFARDESRRTGAVHGVRVTDNGIVEVQQWDTAVVPKVLLGVARNPLTRQPYAFNFGEDSATRGVVRVNVVSPFAYDGISNRNRVMFGASGQPLWIQNDGTAHLLTDGRVQLALEDDRRDVVLTPLIGRVTVETP